MRVNGFNESDGFAMTVELSPHSAVADAFNVIRQDENRDLVPGDRIVTAGLTYEIVSL